MRNVRTKTAKMEQALLGNEDNNAKRTLRAGKHALRGDKNKKCETRAPGCQGQTIRGGKLKKTRSKMMKHLTSGTVKNRKSALRDDAPPTPRPFFMQRFSPRGRGGAREWYGGGRPSRQKLAKVSKNFAKF